MNSERDKERRDRKRRQWGLHGKYYDRTERWYPPRDITNHHYVKWWRNRRKDTCRKWMTLYHAFFLRRVKDKIERRRLVEIEVNKHMAIEYKDHYAHRLEEDIS